MCSELKPLVGKSLRVVVEETILQRVDRFLRAHRHPKHRKNQPTSFAELLFLYVPVRFMAAANDAIETMEGESGEPPSSVYVNNNVVYVNIRWRKRERERAMEKRFYVRTQQGPQRIGRNVERGEN